MKKYILISLSSLAFFAIVGCSSTPKEETISTEIVPVRTTTLSSGVVALPILASGVVSSESEARLSFKTGGIIARLLVKEGDLVQKGQLLASLQLTEISAQVAQAREGSAKAKRDYQRVEALRKDSAVTLEQYQNAKTASDVAEQTLQIALFNQQYSSITSPVTGRIIRKLANEGELAPPGSPVYVIQAEGSADWVMRFGIPDVDWTRLNKGDSASVMLDAYPGEKLRAVITTLSSAADPYSGTFQTELKLATGTKKLASGMVGRVELIPSGKTTGMIIPMDALCEAQEDKAHVFVLNSDGKTVSRKDVRIISLQTKSAIVSGIEDASEVVITGASFLQDKMEVKKIK